MDPKTETANEPVELQDDADFMDTGVLHERKKKTDELEEDSDA